MRTHTRVGPLTAQELQEIKDLMPDLVITGARIDFQTVTRECYLCLCPIADPRDRFVVSHYVHTSDRRTDYTAATVVICTDRYTCDFLRSFM